MSLLKKIISLFKKEDNVLRYGDSFAYNYTEFKIGDIVRIKMDADVPVRYKGRKSIIVESVNSKVYPKPYGLKMQGSKSLLWVNKYDIEVVR